MIAANRTVGETFFGHNYLTYHASLKTAVRLRHVHTSFIVLHAKATESIRVRFVLRRRNSYSYYLCTKSLNFTLMTRSNVGFGLRQAT